MLLCFLYILLMLPFLYKSFVEELIYIFNKEKVLQSKLYPVKNGKKENRRESKLQRRKVILFVVMS